MTNETREVDVAHPELLTAGAAALGVHLNLAQLEQFKQYYLELVDWNSRVNLTSIKEWEQVQTRLFLNSLSVVLAVPSGLLKAGRFVDVGSGAGFPGLALKIAFPGIHVTLIEATAKKTAFLNHLKETLGLPDVDIVTGRSETVAHDLRLREGFDVVLARALARMNALAELTLPFCRPGGIVIAQKSADVEDEVIQAKKAIETMGGVLREVKELAIPELERQTTLVVLEKVNPTPERYPRQPGMPAKRPI